MNISGKHGFLLWTFLSACFISTCQIKCVTSSFENAVAIDLVDLASVFSCSSLQYRPFHQSGITGHDGFQATDLPSSRCPALCSIQPPQASVSAAGTHQTCI